MSLDQFFVDQFFVDQLRWNLHQFFYNLNFDNFLTELIFYEFGISINLDFFQLRVEFYYISTN